MQNYYDGKVYGFSVVKEEGIIERLYGRTRSTATISVLNKDKDIYVGYVFKNLDRAVLLKLPSETASTVESQKFKDNRDLTLQILKYVPDDLKVKKTISRAIRGITEELGLSALPFIHPQFPQTEPKDLLTYMRFAYHLATVEKAETDYLKRMREWVGESIPPGQLKEGLAKKLGLNPKNTDGRVDNIPLHQLV